MAGDYIIAVLLLAALVVMAIFIAPDIRDAFEEEADFTGDCWNVPPEGMSRPAKGSGAGWSEAKADRLNTQNGGTHTGRPRVR